MAYRFGSSSVLFSGRGDALGPAGDLRRPSAPEHFVHHLDRSRCTLGGADLIVQYGRRVPTLPVRGSNRNAVAASGCTAQRSPSIDHSRVPGSSHPGRVVGGAVPRVAGAIADGGLRIPSMNKRTSGRQRNRAPVRD